MSNNWNENFCWTSKPPAEPNQNPIQSTSSSRLAPGQSTNDNDASKFRGFQLPLSSPSLTNPDYKLRCSSCSEVILHKRLIDDRRFVILENCDDIVCIDCVKPNNRCPVCDIYSERMVDMCRFVKKPEEKLELFRNLALLNQIKYSKNEIKTSSKSISENAGSSGTVSNLSTPVIGSRPSSMEIAPITADDAEMAQDFEESGGCLIKEEEQASASQAKQDETYDDESTRRSLDDSKLMCQICHQSVLTNPNNRSKNHHHSSKFGILENCSHIFCAVCIENRRRQCLKCPVCNVRSKRMVKVRRFVDCESSLVKQKKLIFSNLDSEPRIESILAELEREQELKRRIQELDSMKIDDNELDCALCSQRVLSNPMVQHHRQFGILENCSHVFCAQCIMKHRSVTLQCPVCQIVSKRIVNLPNFVYRHDQKMLIFSRMHRQYSRF